MEEHFCVALPPISPFFSNSDYTIDFFFLTGGSCYNSNNNLSWLLVPLEQSCGENRRKSAAFYDLWGLFDPCLLGGSTNEVPTWEMDYELCSAEEVQPRSFEDDGIDVCAD